MARVAVIGIAWRSPLSRRMSRVPHLVVDDARGHEQRRLEHRVVHDVEDRRDDGERGAEAGERGDQPEVADGGIGEQPLQVVLEEREERAEQEGGHARRGHDPEPRVGVAERRPEAHQQEHARLHHGRRVQVGA